MSLDYLTNIGLKQIVEIIVGILLIVSALVEWNKKLPFQPISSFISWVGKNLMKNFIDDIDARFDGIDLKFDEINSKFKGVNDTFEKLEKTHKKISDDLEKTTKESNIAIKELGKMVDERFKEHKKEADEKEAKRLRAGIISFSDSCRVKDRHTKKHFENIFRDYDDYIAYCSKHNIPNHYIEGEYEYIQSVYQKCLRENSFL